MIAKTDQRIAPTNDKGSCFIRTERPDFYAHKLNAVLTKSCHFSKSFSNNGWQPCEKQLLPINANDSEFVTCNLRILCNFNEKIAENWTNAAAA